MLRKVVAGEAITAQHWNELVDEIKMRTVTVDPATMRMFRMPAGTLLSALGAAGLNIPFFYGTLDAALAVDDVSAYVVPMTDMWFGTDPGTSAVLVYNIPQTIDDGNYLFEGNQYADCLCIYSAERDAWYFVWVQCIPEPPATATAASGTDQASAAAISDAFHSVSAADGTKGVRHVLTAAMQQRGVFNADATNNLKVYPPSGGAINGGTMDAAVTVGPKTYVVFQNLSATAWVTVGPELA